MKTIKTLAASLGLLLAALLPCFAYTANPNLSAGGTNAGLVASGALGYTVLSPADGATVLQARSTSGITDQGNGYYVVTGGVTFTTASVLVKWDRSDTGAVLGIGTTTAPTSAGTSTSAYLAPTLTHNSSGQLVLTWPQDSTATGYIVLRSMDNRATFQVVASVPSSTLTYTDTTRPAGGTAYYHIVATH